MGFLFRILRGRNASTLRDHRPASLPEQLHLRERVNSLVLESLVPVSGALAVVYLVVSLNYAFILEIAGRTPLTVLAAGTALLMLVFFLMLSDWRLSSGFAHPLALLIAAVVLANTVAHLLMVPDSSVSMNLIYLMLGSGFVLLSARWYMGASGLIILGWVVIAIIEPRGFNWEQSGITLLLALALSIIIHVVRRHMVRRLESWRYQDASRRRVLENALRNEAHMREQLEKVVASSKRLEERFRLLSEATFEGVAVLEGAVIRDANESFGRLFGSHVEDLIGTDMASLVERSERIRVREALVERIQEPFETVGMRAGGRVFPLEICCKSMRFRQKVIHVAAFRNISVRKEAEDTLKQAQAVLERRVRERTAELYTINQALKREILNRKKVEDALIQSKERFRDLFENAPDIYLILDAKFNIVGMNNRGFRQLGFAPTEIVRRPIIEFVHADDREILRRVLQDIRRTGHAPRNIEVRMLRKDGSATWVSKEFSFLNNREGRLQAIRVACRDIEERKQLQEELARTQRLQTAGQVAGQIAHDFNNLLAPLTGYPQMLRVLIDDDEEAIELLAEMENSARKIADINQQLLALGRRGHYSMEPVNLRDLVKHVISALRLPERITVQENHDVHLLNIRAGAAQLVRVITNILTNAAESIEGEGTLALRTANVYLDQPLRGYNTVERGEYVLLAIADTGAGIPPDIMDKIFDPFFSTKTMDKMRGSGLGLSVVHGIVEDHKGYITVRSVEGEGTEFALYFPIDRTAQLEADEPPEPVRGGTENILVVDDDPTQQRVLSQILRKVGYHVSAVSSGEEAVQLLKSRRQDIIILDMVMGGIDGAETYRRILKSSPDQKAIVLSGYAPSQLVKEAIRLGAGAFVPKPIEPNKILPAIRRVLDRRRTEPVEEEEVPVA